ncbi:MAG: hypothetical protein COT61_05355 [Candidatus Portnoybacteria bacterium CG09_land_8_20_14_0_10_44_13]|uniref:DUF4258 domain-containing protein n=1 Tax=Candidatus Portnoybacteria bacterium CG09_land_8_20_14_0_10_44_13 TaxID=1974811 RepID=A0A2H0WU74_9BACT|nr:MAG: hypothetical protein COT61_05355 [Candidatus Portnoybacteria bacterium CG09_land_8_20_14_0_10_44_13]
MKLNFIKTADKFLWTNHAQQKMRFYRLSESRVKRVVRHPARVERGIATETSACMQRGDSRKRKEEVWVMYQRKIQTSKDKIVIISAWRYPGVSPLGEPFPIPEDVLTDLKEFIREKAARC